MYALTVIISTAFNVPPPPMPNDCKLLIALIRDVNHDIQNMDDRIDSLKKLAKQFPRSATEFNELIVKIEKLKKENYKQRNKFIFELLGYYLEFP